MSLQTGQLLISRLRRTLSEGITTIDTGLTQVNRGLSPDPPLGGSDPTADAAGVPSRVMVVPQAPLEPWYTGNVHHGEPYVESTTGAVKVDFWVAAGTGEQTINVEFWDPHTVVTPMDAETYNEFTCTAPSSPAGFGGGGQGNSSPMGMTNPATAAGQLLIACAVVSLTADFGDPASAPVFADPGWTILGTGEVDFGGDAGLKMIWGYRITTDAEPVGYTVTWTTSGPPGGNFLIEQFVNIDTTTPVQDVSAVVIESTPENPFSIDAPSLTAATANETLACWWIGGSNNAIFVIPLNMRDNQGTVHNFGFFNEPPLTLSFSWLPLGASGPTGAKTGTMPATLAAGMAFSVLLNGICGLFPDGSGG